MTRVREDLVDILRRDAQKHIKAKTLKLPVDVEEFANRLVEANEGAAKSLLGRFLAKISGFPFVTATYEEYVDAIKAVCDELDLETK